MSMQVDQRSQERAGSAPRPGVDAVALEAKVKAMYRAVAEDPGGTFHFETGRPLAERLGYPAALLDRVPSGAVEAFAGVGYFLDLADLRPGESVLDLGSGSGMDSFAAALVVGERGRVVGIDMTPEQLARAERLRQRGDFGQVAFQGGRIEALPFADGSFDVAISNGVINLAPDKERVFREAGRVLRPGGRLAVADIVTRAQLSDAIVCDADLWASCIGGAAQLDAYQEAISAAGLRVERMRENPYGFLSGQARRASATYGVMSVSILARRDG
jgi:arsenite methyltransferase